MPLLLDDADSSAEAAEEDTSSDEPVNDIGATVDENDRTICIVDRVGAAVAAEQVDRASEGVDAIDAPVRDAAAVFVVIDRSV